MANLKDVATLAGVSLSTASIVIRGLAEQRKISSSTVERVFKAVQELDYKPSIAARSLRGHKIEAPIIALYWANDFRTSMLARFLDGLQSITQSSTKYSIMIMPYQSGELHTRKELEDGKSFHAALIANANADDLEYLDSTSLPIPIVLYHRLSNKYPCVSVDDSEMGKKAAFALLTRNKSNFAILGSDAVFKGMEYREMGFLQTVNSNGSTNIQILRNQNSVAGGIAMVEQIYPNVDGLFCVSDAIAFGALMELRRKGIEVPEQISIVSIGNGDQTYTTGVLPAISTVFLPMEEMANKCLMLLLDLLQHKEIPKSPLILDTPFIMRES